MNTQGLKVGDIKKFKMTGGEMVGLIIHIDNTGAKVSILNTSGQRGVLNASAMIEAVVARGLDKDTRNRLEAFYSNGVEAERKRQQLSELQRQINEHNQSRQKMVAQLQAASTGAKSTEVKNTLTTREAERLAESVIGERMPYRLREEYRAYLSVGIYKGFMDVSISREAERMHAESATREFSFVEMEYDGRLILRDDLTPTESKQIQKIKDSKAVRMKYCKGAHTVESGIAITEKPSIDVITRLRFQHAPILTEQSVRNMAEAVEIG